MLFIVTVRTPSTSYKAVMERFKTSGGHPPAGVRMLGRWHRADGSGAVVIAETDNAAALAKWTAEWADLLSIESTPALTDEALAAILA